METRSGYQILKAVLGYFNSVKRLLYGFEIKTRLLKDKYVAREGGGLDKIFAFYKTSRRSGGGVEGNIVKIVKHTTLE